MRKIFWRLIISSPSSGSWNMAIDEAILEEVVSRAVPTTLRLYSWHPYCLSIGHAQSISEVNTDFLIEKGWGMVRRPTGGRAILHADELTYSINAPIDDPHIQGGVIESYRHLSHCLLHALDLIGIKTDSKPKIAEEKHLSKNPVCFQYPSDYEITFHGKKLVGSAQARKINGVLQHGAIPLFGDISRIVSTLNYKIYDEKIKAKNSLLTRATTLQDVMGHMISWKEMADAILRAFEETLNIHFIYSSLSPNELNRAKTLQKEKYKNNVWTFRI
jgi:lipoate-protein ligase A